MTPTPTGRLQPTPTGRDLILVREFTAPIEDVWASVTEPQRCGRWFGTWKGDPRPGDSVEFTMTAEEGNPTSTMTILACDPPQLVAVSSVDDYGTWHLEARLSHADGVTRLEFVHHLDDRANPAEVGPGWEYYLDRLVASRGDGEMPDFDDYFPAMKAYFERQPDRGDCA